jgi:hypothetical protein
MTFQTATIAFFPELLESKVSQEALEAIPNAFEETVWSEDEAISGSPLDVSWDFSGGTLEIKSDPVLSGWKGTEDPELLEWLNDNVYLVAEQIADDYFEEGQDQLCDEVVMAFDLAD